MAFPSDDRLIARAVRSLRKNREHRAADLLLSCSLQWRRMSALLAQEVAPGGVNERPHCVSWSRIELMTDGEAFDILADRAHPIRASVERALATALPEDRSLDGVDVARASPTGRR